MNVKEVDKRLLHKMINEGSIMRTHTSCVLDRSCASKRVLGAVKACMNSFRLLEGTGSKGM